MTIKPGENTMLTLQAVTHTIGGNEYFEIENKTVTGRRYVYAVDSDDHHDQDVFAVIQTAPVYVLEYAGDEAAALYHWRQVTAPVYAGPVTVYWEDGVKISNGINVF